MANTPNLTLPEIVAGEAGLPVHNEALRIIDALCMLAVIDRDLIAPPAAPAEGDRYLVAAPAEGVWSGREGQLAFSASGAWVFLAPKPGWRAYVADEAKLIVYTGVEWRDFGAGLSLDNLLQLGINAAADAINRLAIKSPASLFDNAGDGHQVKVNKAEEADTASFLFQTAYSGRAEIGLTGDDDFHFKVSPDGVTFHTPLTLGRFGPKALFHVGRGSANGVSVSDVVDGLKVGHVRLSEDGSGVIDLFRREGGSPDRTTKTLQLHGAGECFIDNGTNRFGIGTPNPSTSLQVAEGVRLGSFTVGTVPDALSVGEGTVISVSDGDSGNSCLAVARGASWKVIRLGTDISST